jgi:hypothetical protein
MYIPVAIDLAAPKRERPREQCPGVHVIEA